jgi:hypothetical protein
MVKFINKNIKKLDNFNKTIFYIVYIILISNMHSEVLNLLMELLKIRSISNDIDRLVDIVNYVDSYFSLFENRIVKRFIFNEKPSIVIQNFE